MDFDDLAAGGTVSSEDLASGKMTFTPDGKVDEGTPSSSEGPHVELFDSADIERKLRENLGQANEVNGESEGEAQEDNPSEETEGQAEEGAEEEAQHEEPKPKGKKKNGVQERISEIVHQRNAERKAREEAEARAQAFQEKFLSAQQQLAQQNQQLQQKLFDLETKRQEMAVEERSKSELARMSPEERRVYEFKQGVIAEAKREIAQEIAARDKKIEELSKWKQGAEEYAQKAKREQEMQRMVHSALDSTVLKGITKNTEQLKPVMEEMLHLFSAAYGQPPEEIAPQLRRFMDLWTQSQTAQIAESGKNKLAKGGKVPKTPVTGKGSTNVANTGKKPTQSEIESMGFNSFAGYNVAKALGRLR